MIEHTRNEPEPMTMTLDYVASWLDYMRRPESADMVRLLAKKCKEANAREDDLRAQISTLYARLKIHEPPASNAVRDPVWTGD